MREVEVPGEECPLVSLPGITVDVPILPVHVDVPDNGRGSHHVDAHRYVDVVEGEIVQRGATLGEAIDQVLKVGIILVAPVLLFEPRIGTSCQSIVVSLIQRAILIEPRALQINIIGVFNEVCRTKKFGVLLYTNRVCEVSMHASITHDLIAHNMANL